MKLFKLSTLLILLLVISCSTRQNEPTKTEKSLEENEIAVLLKKEVEKEQGDSISDLEPKEIKHEGEDTFVYFFFLKDNQRHEGLSYLNSKNNVWKIIHTETTRSLSDLQVTNFQIGGETTGEIKKTYLVTAGYCTDDKINEIKITDSKNDLFLFKLNADKRTYMHISLNNTVGLKEIQGVDSAGKAIYHRSW